MVCATYRALNVISYSLLHSTATAPQIDNPQNATPFYLNAEWYLSKIHVLGVDVEYEMMNPVLATADMPNEHLYWKEGYSCVCIHKVSVCACIFVCAFVFVCQ